MQFVNVLHGYSFVNQVFGCIHNKIIHYYKILRVNKLKFKTWLLLISIPLASEISMAFIGVFGLVVTNIVYLPIAWLGDPFVTCNSEIGCLPKEYGRILMFLLISLGYYIYCKIKGLE